MKRTMGIFLVVFMIDSCSILPRSATIADFMPRETDVPGWVIARQYRLNDMKKIERVIPYHTDYDPVELVAADYNYLSDTSRIIRVEIIRFHSSLDAFGLYSRERGFDAAVLFMDKCTYSSEHGIFFRLGKYYVKISGENLNEKERASFEQFRGVVRQNLKKHTVEEQLPDYLPPLSGGNSTRNVIYYKKGIDTIPGGQALFVMRRAIAGRNYDIVSAKLPAMLASQHEFHRILKSSDRAFMLSRIGNLQLAIRIISDSEYLFISWYKHWIFGVLNAENMNEGNRVILYLFGEIKM